MPKSAIRITEPGGQERLVPAALANPGEGRYTAAARFDQAGVYMIAADVRRGTQPLGTTRRPVLVGGSDVELSEPRLNEPVLAAHCRADRRTLRACRRGGDAGWPAARSRRRPAADGDA